MSILVFGSANADLVFTVPHLPAPGETVLGEGFSAYAGGKGANQAVAAARDGGSVAFAGCVGSDAFAAVASTAMRQAGVDLTRMLAVDAPTGVASICVDAAGQNQIAVAPGANFFARADQVEDAALKPETILLMQMEVPAAEITALITRATVQGARCILNLAPPGDLPREYFQALHLLVLNQHEAAVLGQRIGIEPTAQALREALGTDVAITAGADGATAATAEGLISIPAFRANVVDTTGAGDTWCGVLAAGLDRGLPLADAMRRAAAAASLACSRAGAAAAMPVAAETDALLATAS